MPYTKEQLRTYWQTHKDHFNHQRREKRRLAREKVSHGKPENGKPSSVIANPTLTRLIKEWLT